MKDLLLKTLHNEIPITKAMGIGVVKADNDEVRLKAPLEANINHKLTAFGGSLNTLAVLACWSMLFVRLQKRGISAHIVIHSSSIKYLRPVTHELQATCKITDEKGFDKLLKMYEKHGKGRITLNAQIYDNDILALSFQGEYVIHK